MGEPLELPMVVTDPTSARPGAAFHRGSSKQNYGTPVALIRAIEKRFGPIAWDLAAEPENAKATQFITKAEDTFTKDWKQLRGHKFLNPEFDDIAPYAKKCMESRTLRSDGLIEFLVPASVGSEWWARYVHEQARVLFLVGRLCFDGIDPYPKDCALCLFNAEPGYECWRWPDELQTDLFEKKERPDDPDIRRQ